MPLTSYNYTPFLQAVTPPMCFRVTDSYLVILNVSCMTISGHKPIDHKLITQISFKMQYAQPLYH